MDLEKEMTKLERALLKDGRKELVEELRSLDNDARRERLMKQAIYEQEVQDTKNKDEKLKSARAMASFENSKYTDQIRMSKKIARYIHLLIEDSGKV